MSLPLADALLLSAGWPSCGFFTASSSLVVAWPSFYYGGYNVAFGLLFGGFFAANADGSSSHPASLLVNEAQKLLMQAYTSFI